MVVVTLLPDDEGLWLHIRRPAGADASEESEEPNERGLGAQWSFRLRRESVVYEQGRLRLALAVDDRSQTVELTFDDGGRLTVAGAATIESLDGAYTPANVKQVLVYRRDLAMRKGKIAAQCAHASMAVFFRRDQGGIDHLYVALDGPMAAWSKGRFAKVVLSVDGEDELLRIFELAQARGLPSALITDAGKTEFHGQPTRTTVAVGPAVSVEIDAITGPEGLVSTKLA